MKTKSGYEHAGGSKRLDQYLNAKQNKNYIFSSSRNLGHIKKSAYDSAKKKTHWNI